MFRAGVATINIELQSYGTAIVLVKDRWCILCVNKDRRCILGVNEIDSECHVLVHNSLYENTRDTFNQSINETQYEVFSSLIDDDKMCFFLSNPIGEN